MRIIERSEFPEDHTYYRTTSPVYNKYLRDHCHIHTLPLEGGTRFGWIKRIFGKYAQLVKFERVDTEPTRELLAPYGFVRGIAIWIPFRRTDIPKGWRKLAVGTHFTRTGFTRIEDSEYYKKWNERARRARKKFLSYDPEKIHIELVDEERFIEAFRQIKVKHFFKSDYIRYYQAMMQAGKDTIRSYVCYHGTTPIAGLAVHDYGSHTQTPVDSQNMWKNDNIRMKTANRSEPYNCTENKGNEVFPEETKCDNKEHLKSFGIRGTQGLNTKIEVTSHIYNESVHLVAFTSQEAKPFQAGTGLIDRWFSDSFARGIEYINFDHLRDSSMTSDQQGYTDFKLNFMENECYFKESYFRFL